MRTTFLVVLAIIAGIALGVEVARLRIAATPWHPDVDQPRERSEAAKKPEEPLPKVVVDETEHDFGTLVKGQITAAAQMLPEELVFSRLDAGESASAKVRLLGFLDEPLKVLGRESSNSATAKYFDIDMQPLSPDELKADDAKSGTMITVTVKPGLPEGAFKQKIVFRTNAATSPEMTLTVQGYVVGNRG